MNSIIGNESTEIKIRPRFEGANIATIIGFKHIMYLMEESVVQVIGDAGYGISDLWENYGLGLEIVDSQVRILGSIKADDDITAVIKQADNVHNNEAFFKLDLFALRDSSPKKLASGKVKVQFRAELNDKGYPDALVPYVVDSVKREASSTVVKSPIKLDKEIKNEIDSLASHYDNGVGSQLVKKTALEKGFLGEEPNGIIWKHKVPYFYCHYRDRLQHSGYIRLIEEAKHLFVQDRGISIQTYLKDRDWIPYVSRCELEILREVNMEEDIYIVYSVEEVFKQLIYTSNTDFYVIRDNEFIHTATGKITHGYGLLSGFNEWGHVDFDEKTVRALSGSHAA